MVIGASSFMMKPFLTPLLDLPNNDPGFKSELVLPRVQILTHQTHDILVANGGISDCYFYDDVTYRKTATLHLASDATHIMMQVVKCE